MIRLLICDDYEPLRAMLAVALATDGDIEVVGEAAGGREAVEQARALQPDVVLLDISLPDVDGLEVLPELATVAPATRTVIISGLDGGFAEQAEALGAVAFVDKRATPEEIRQVIREAVL
jgi:DNA-binding NarL/FixJ family response regulator